MVRVSSGGETISITELACRATCSYIFSPACILLQTLSVQIRSMQQEDSDIGRTEEKFPMSCSAHSTMISNRSILRSIYLFAAISLMEQVAPPTFDSWAAKVRWM